MRKTRENTVENFRVLRGTSVSLEASGRLRKVPGRDPHRGKQHRLHQFDGKVDCSRIFASAGMVKPAIQFRAEVGSISAQERSVIAAASSRFAVSAIKSIVPAALFG